MKVFEFNYFNIATSKPVLKYQFNSIHLDSIQITLSHDGKTIAIRTASRNTVIINSITGSVIKVIKDIPNVNIVFPNYDHSFYIHNPFNKVIIRYDTYTGKLLKMYNSANRTYGYGKIWITKDDKYIIQQKSSTKFNIWHTNNQNRLKTISATSYKIDYVNNQISFVKETKVTTYDLKSLNYKKQFNLKYFKRDFEKEKAKNEEKVIFGNELLSHSGNFFVVPYSCNGKNSLMICSTQRDENKKIPITNLAEIHNIEWLNDSTLAIKHKNNTVSLMQLNDYKNIKLIDFKVHTRKFKKFKHIHVAPNYEFYVTTKTSPFSNGITVHNSTFNTTSKNDKTEFICFTEDGKYIIVKDSKNGRYGKINPFDNDNNSITFFSDSLDSFTEVENLDNEEPIPKDYKPYQIKKLKHISELKDSSAMINLILKNIEFTDSTISINTHLIDDDGIYYYGASSLEWKHIWCNFLLKHNKTPLKQVTDFEIIEHRGDKSENHATAIVMDHSGSMGQLRAKRLQKAVVEYINQKDKKDAIALIKFDHKTGIESYLLSDEDKLIENFNQTGLKKYGGGTSILDGINAGISILNDTEEGTEKSIILLTDGAENSSYMGKNEVIKRAIENNIRVYIIGYGKDVEEYFLKSIAKPTNGSYYKIYREIDFSWIYNDIDLKMKNYYEIKFKSGELGSYKSILKICVSENQSDTLSLQFKNFPFEKDKIELENENAYSIVKLNEEINEFEMLPDIKNFDNIKTDSGIEELPIDSLSLNIETEFESISLPDIKFEHNKTKIITSSLVGIDDVFNFMKKYPSVQIEISGHTDSDGNDEMNMILSKKRAVKIKSILVERGISADRIISKGFGELFPLVENVTELDKQKNRRVEFKVL